MKNYKIYDGTNWVSPCDVAMKILSWDKKVLLPPLPNTIPAPEFVKESLDPYTRDVRFYDGHDWKRISCCTRCGVNDGDVQINGGLGFCNTCYDIEVHDFEICIDSGTTVFSIEIGLPTSGVHSTEVSFLAGQLLSFNKTVLLAQTGYFGKNNSVSNGISNTTPPTLATYNSNGVLGVPGLTIDIVAQSYPVYNTLTGALAGNTNINHIPIAIDPTHPGATSRTLTYVRANPNVAEKIFLRLFNNPCFSCSSVHAEISNSQCLTEPFVGVRP